MCVLERVVGGDDGTHEQVFDRVTEVMTVVVVVVALLYTGGGGCRPQCAADVCTMGSLVLVQSSHAQHSVLIITTAVARASERDKI